MKRKGTIIVTLAAALLLLLAACGKTDKASAPETETPAAEEQTTEETAQQNTETEEWKAEFEKSLFENYGVKPVRYEYLENGVYQVYVEIGGKVVPFVAVDSATGDYHG